MHAPTRVIVFALAVVLRSSLQSPKQVLFRVDCPVKSDISIVCFGLDEFYELKFQRPEIAETERQDMFFNEGEVAEDYAKRWLMIPLTRAIDTLVLHSNDDSSYVGSILKYVHNNTPKTFNGFHIK